MLEGMGQDWITIMSYVRDGASLPAGAATRA
jgi:hypothetical protein